MTKNRNRRVFQVAERGCITWGRFQHSESLKLPDMGCMGTNMLKVKIILVGGIPTPLKNMKVSWDDEIPKIWKVIKFMFQTTKQYRWGYQWENKNTMGNLLSASLCGSNQNHHGTCRQPVEAMTIKTWMIYLHLPAM